MSKSREIRLNTFQFAAPSHNWAGLWRHPRDNQTDYNRLDYWVDMARLAERGLLDGIFCTAAMRMRRLPLGHKRRSSILRLRSRPWPWQPATSALE